MTFNNDTALKYFETIFKDYSQVEESTLKELLTFLNNHSDLSDEIIKKYDEALGVYYFESLCSYCYGKVEEKIFNREKVDGVSVCSECQSVESGSVEVLAFPKLKIMVVLKVKGGQWKEIDDQVMYQCY